MKITIKPKEKVEEVITYDNLKPGTVFEYRTGVIALKLDHGEAVLLKHTIEGLDYFDVAVGYKTSPIRKILGHVDEIIVVPDDS